MNRKRRFFFNTAVLAVGSVLLRLCGLWFRSVIAARIGAGGMGLFQLVYSVFALGITACTSGFGLAMTRLTAEGNASRLCVRRCVCLALGLSAAALCTLFFGSDFIAERFILNAEAARPLRFLALGLPCIACCACLKGWFFAQRNTVVPMLGEFWEEGVTIGLSLLLLNRSPLPPLENLTLGATLGELAATLYICPAFLVFAKRKGFAREGGSIRQIIHISGPMLAGSLLRSGLSGAENILIPIGLQKNGADGVSALSQYGVVQGMVMPILYFPMSLISSAAMLLIPDIAEASAHRNAASIRRTAEKAFCFTQVFGFCAAAVFFVFARELGEVFFGSAQAAEILRILAPLGPLMYLDNVADNLLKGLDQQLFSLKLNLADSALRVLLIAFLLPAFGIRAYLALLFASEIFNGTLSVGRLLRTAHIKPDLRGWVLRPAAASGLLALALSAGKAIFS